MPKKITFNQRATIIMDGISKNPGIDANGLAKLLNMHVESVRKSAVYLNNCGRIKVTIVKTGNSKSNAFAPDNTATLTAQLMRQNWNKNLTLTTA